ncbi:MAG: Na+:solute symporter [Tannerellaceae bacterium]|jgi:Na+/proline symporter|nr:Na+:solute symporter [Tannerellaceae bacterium]
MKTIDYSLIIVYFIGILIVGMLFSSKMKSSKDLFAAGKNSPWWVSGLSTYMTLFSAGTFVVWGGIAYRLGFVAVSILMVIGIASIFVGKFVAGRWRETGVDTPAEYVGIRFGKKTISFYTIVGLVSRAMTTAVALYAIAVLLAALIPLPENHILRDPNTGNLSVAHGIIIVGVITLIYTIAGGLWAVMMTDVVQFIVLCLMVVLLIPLSVKSVGGLTTFIETAPKGFFSLVSGGYSFVWLILWCVTYFFMVGGDWPFVQRYISVPKPKDAKKAAYLVGVLYLITPILWMLPSLIYRVINPNADPEQSYILIGQLVLPAGLIGLMMAAMLSATMSMVSSMLNVFAGVLTHDVYHYYKPNASEKKLVLVGRLFTLLFGIVTIGLAILIPLFGGAESVIVTFVTLVIGPLAIPSIWGLFSKKITQKAVWISLGTTYVTGIIVRSAPSISGLFINQRDGIRNIISYMQSNVELIDAIVGMVLPITILTIMELKGRRKDISEGWKQLLVSTDKSKNEEVQMPSASLLKLPALILVSSLGILGIILGGLAMVLKSDQNILTLFASILFASAILIYAAYILNEKKLGK